MISLWIAIVGAVQAVAIVGLPLWFARRQNRNRAEDQADRAEVAKKVEGNQTTLDEIHQTTNTNYQIMVKKLEEANEKIEQLLKAQSLTREKL